MPWASLPANTGHIYCLLEPDSNEIRYVGQTVINGGAAARRCAHLVKMRRDPDNKTHLYNWLRSLDARNREPRVQLLAVLPKDQLNDSEIFWIAYLKSIGCDLVNSTPGGTGGPIRKGMKTPPETAAKQGAAWVGRKHSADSVAKIKAARAKSNTYARSCVVCRQVFNGYMGLRNHQVKHSQKTL